MRTDPLQRLLDTARALPGSKASVPPLTPLISGEALSSTGGPTDIAAMRRRVGALLIDLAAALEPALLTAMEHATRSWDQVDAVDVMGAMRDRVVDQRIACQSLVGHGDPLIVAAATEALLTLDAAAGLVTLMERRLATLVRLRHRCDDPSLLCDGRPFLDVAAALQQAGRAWI